MDDAREDRLIELVDQALDAEVPERDWPAFLAERCPDDAELRAVALQRLHDASDAPPDAVGPAFGATVPAVTDPIVGTIVDQRYRIEALHSRGGMGLVYRATLVLGSVHNPWRSR